VAALAAAHGGRAFVHSVPGHGTMFTVELPASDTTTDGADVGLPGSEASADGGSTLTASGPAPAVDEDGSEANDLVVAPAVSEDPDTLVPAHRDQRPVRR